MLIFLKKKNSLNLREIVLVFEILLPKYKKLQKLWTTSKKKKKDLNIVECRSTFMKF